MTKSYYRHYICIFCDNIKLVNYIIILLKVKYYRIIYNNKLITISKLDNALFNIVIFLFNTYKFSI